MNSFLPPADEDPIDAFSPLIAQGFVKLIPPSTLKATTKFQVYHYGYKLIDILVTLAVNLVWIGLVWYLLGLTPLYPIVQQGMHNPAAPMWKTGVYVSLIVTSVAIHLNIPYFTTKFSTWFAEQIGALDD